jgi:hypothetical protein
VALRAALPRLSVLTGAERGLLEEWLDRVAAGRDGGGMTERHGAMPGRTFPDVGGGADELPI